jgi:hypothetical protein
MSLEVVFINGEHHLHHLSRSQLRFLVILFAGAFHMAELASHAQGRGDELHPGNYLVSRNSLQNLNIFELFFRLSRTSGGRRSSARLRPSRADLNSPNCEECDYPDNPDKSPLAPHSLSPQ